MVCVGVMGGGSGSLLKEHEVMWGEGGGSLLQECAVVCVCVCV